MRLLDTNVRYFDETDKGIVFPEHRWGSYIDLLDMVLVNGTPTQPILSITTVEDPTDNKYWLSTIVLNVGHNFKTNLSVVRISGISDTSYNGLFRVQSSSPNTITIAFDKSIVTTKPKDITDTTGATIKLEPLGYIKVFSDTNKAVYKTTDPNANICYLRVDNSCPVGYDPSWAKMARVSIYSDMINIDDYKFRPGRIKAPAYFNDYNRAEEQWGSGASGFYGETKWYTGVYYGETQIYRLPTTFKFEIVGDSRTFYFFQKVSEDYSKRLTYCFGEYIDLFNSNNINNHILGACEFRHAAQEGYSISDNQDQLNCFNKNYPNSNGKYMLNEYSSDYNQLQNHAKFSFYTPIVRTSLDTAVSFNNTCLSINFMELPIIAYYPTGSILKGKMRGYHFIGNNLQENPLLVPSERSVVNNIKNSKDLFVMLNVGQSNGDGIDTFMGRIGIKLNNWS